MSTVAGWSTPRRIQAYLVGIWLTALLFFLAGLYGVHAHRDAVQTIGKDAVPSILAAQQLKVSLSDLDANVVNALITPLGQNVSSVKGYVEDRQTITDSLIKAAQNITYGDLERIPIRNLTNALSAYERLAIKSETLHVRGDERGAISTYRDALTQLHESLLPAADALSKANTEVLKRRDSEQQAAMNTSRALVIVAALLLLVVALSTQVFLVARTRRLLNPALLLATLIALAGCLTTLHAFGVAREDVRSARDDSFASLALLWNAKATAYDANSDESRWLFDKERRPALEQAFFDKNALLINLSAGQSYGSMASATANGATLPAGTTGYFAEELKNVTFAGEKSATQKMIEAFGVYYAKDQRIRELENGGQHAEAVRFCNSSNPGDSDWAFVQFDNALGSTIDINQKAFDDAVNSGFAAVSHLDLVLAIEALLVGALGFVGLRARLREYDL